MADVNLSVAVTSAGVPAAIAQLTALKAAGLQTGGALNQLATASSAVMAGLTRAATSTNLASNKIAGYGKAMSEASRATAALNKELTQQEKLYSAQARLDPNGTPASRLARAGGAAGIAGGLAIATQIAARNAARSATLVGDADLYAAQQAEIRARSVQRLIDTESRRGARVGVNRAREDMAMEARGATALEMAQVRLTRATQDLARAEQARLASGGIGVSNRVRTAAMLEEERAIQRLTAAQRELRQAQEGAHAKANGGTGNAFMSSFSYFIIAGMAQQATQAIMGMGTAAITASSQIERAFADVERTFEGTGSQLSALQGRLRQLATTTPISIIDLSQIAALGNQLGIAAEDIESFTQTIAQYSAISGMSAEDSATAFGRIANLTGLAASQFSNLASAITYTARTTVATESTIANTAKEITALSSGAGFSAKSIVGLAGALSSLAIPPERARGALSLYFGALNTAVAEGGPKLAAFAMLTGKSADEIGRLVRANEGQEVFTSFIAGLAELDTVAKTTALDTLGLSTIRVDQTMRALAQNVPLVTKSLAGSAKAFDENTEVGMQYAIIQETLTSKFIQFQNSIQIAAGAVGDKLAPAMMFLLQAATDTVVAFTDFADSPIGAAVLLIAGLVTGVVLAFTALTGVLALAKASLILIPWALTGLSARVATTGVVQFIAGMFNLKLSADAAGISATKLSTALATTGVASRAAAAGLTTMKWAMAGTGLLLGAAIIGTIVEALGMASEKAKLTASEISGLDEAIKTDTATWRETGEAIAVFSTKAGATSEEQKKAAQESKNWANVLGTDLVGGAEAAAAAVDKIAAGESVVAKIRETLAADETIKRITSDSGFASMWKGLGLNMTEMIEEGLKGGDINKRIAATLKGAGFKKFTIPMEIGPDIKGWEDAAGNDVTEMVGHLFEVGTAVGSTNEAMQGAANTSAVLASGMDLIGSEAEELKNGVRGSSEALVAFQDNLQGGLKSFVDFKDIMKSLAEANEAANKDNPKVVDAAQFQQGLQEATARAVTFYEGIDQLAKSGRTQLATELAGIGPDAQAILSSALDMSGEAQASLEADARFAAFLASDAFKTAYEQMMTEEFNAYAMIFKETGSFDEVKGYIAAQLAGTGEEWERQWLTNHPTLPLSVDIIAPDAAQIALIQAQVGGTLVMKAAVEIEHDANGRPRVTNSNIFTDTTTGNSITLPANLSGAALNTSLAEWLANQNLSPKEILAKVNKPGLSADLDAWRAAHGPVTIGVRLSIPHIPDLGVDKNGRPINRGAWAKGGEVDRNNLPKFANGGSWGQFRGPGTGTSDDILARVSNGEYINTADATGFWGPDFFDSLNRKMLPTSFLNMLGAAAGGGGGPTHVAHVSMVQNNPLTRDPLKQLREESEMVAAGIWGRD